MIAEILCVGTELLMGQVLNTNAQFLSRRLSALGITQQHQTVVGDNAQRLEDAYRLALSRADIVITSGGLGPTVDDITKRVAAKVAGKELVLFPEAEKMVRTRFQQYHRNMTLNNLSQAMFTADSTLLMNPNGTAPGAIVPMGDGKVVIHLPGPPCELEPMFTASVEPYLMARSGRALVSRYVRIFGMGESEVDTRLRDLENGENPTLSPYCTLGEVQLRATASADTAEKALALLTPLLAEVKARLGNVVYAMEETDGGSLAKTAIETLRARGMTCATCESLTGGKVVAALVDIPGASAVVRAGLVTYQTDTKTILADVPAEVIERFGVVSVETACAMAEGTRKRLGVDIAVSTTGVAGPDGGTEDCPVGTVCVGVSTADGTSAVRLALSGNRERIRIAVLSPAWDMNEHSSLSRYLTRAVEQCGAEGSGFFFHEDGLDFTGVERFLDEAAADGEPVMLMGASSAYLYLLDYLDKQGKTYALAADSRVFDTGGFKSTRTDMTVDDLYAAFERVFGVKRSHCVNMYGMTELSSQIYDQNILSYYTDGSSNYLKATPSWVRSVFLDPASLTPVADGEQGVIAHYDLANWNSCLAILTEDLGVRTEHGYVLNGRAKGAEARGCSITVDEVMAANA